MRELKKPHPADYKTESEYWYELDQYELELKTQEGKRNGADEAFKVWVVMCCIFLMFVLFMVNWIINL